MATPLRSAAAAQQPADLTRLQANSATSTVDGEPQRTRATMPHSGISSRRFSGGESTIV
jgi:hypothetical protein